MHDPLALADNTSKGDIFSIHLDDLEVLLARISSNESPLASDAKIYHAQALPSTPIKLVDLSEPSTSTWHIVNDGVMGGISVSDFQICQAVGVFSGRLLADNNGGFASVRTAMTSAIPRSLQSIVIRVRGDGKRYQFRVRTSDSSDMPAYKYSFETKPDRWQEVSIALADLQATFRGRPVADAAALQAQSICWIGFLIAGKQFGSFRLEIESILGVASP